MTPTRGWPPRVRLAGNRTARRARGALVVAAITLGCLAVGWWLLPYRALSRLERALPQGPATLAGLVDIDAVRDELRRRLDKDQTSSIGPLSGPFIDWLQWVLRDGDAPGLEQAVTLDWVHALLRSRALSAAPSPGALVTRAGYENPGRFRVIIDGGSQPPLHLIWRRRGLRWQVVALYF